jgi:hypothetical protein
MFPDTTLIQAHIGGGGDWEWNLRVLETCPTNVYIDTSGSVIDHIFSLPMAQTGTPENVYQTLRSASHPQKGDFLAHLNFERTVLQP